MQEALKNTHYKKIWEKVIMNRHQDCDSIEKALLHESTHKGCLIALDDKPCHILPIDDGLVEYDFMRPNIAKLIHIEDPEVNDIQCEVCNNCLSVEGLPSFIASINKVKFYSPQILGRPITLEDILILFTKTYNEIQFFDTARISNGREYRCFIELKHNTPDVSESVKYGKIEWQLTKPLHEQTPETWEKIANLI